MSLTLRYEHSVRIYAEDVDFMGIVYHANYLCYFERARTELLRQNNMMLSELVKADILFAIHELKIKYVLPAKLDDFLTITTQIEDVKVCSLTFVQVMINQQGQLLCEANVRVVCVDSTLKPKRLPKLIK